MEAYVFPQMSMLGIFILAAFMISVVLGNILEARFAQKANKGQDLKPVPPNYARRDTGWTIRVGQTLEESKMKKISIMIIAIVTLFALVGNTAKAERYFTGNLVYQTPGNERVDFAWRMCTDFSSWADGEKFSFELNTCSADQSYRFGFTGDNRVVVSILKDEKPAFIVSQNSARSLRNEVEHGTQSSALGNIKKNQEEDSIQQAFYACVVRVNGFNEVMATSNLGTNIAAQSAEDECEKTGEQRDLPLLRIAYRKILNNDTGGGALSPNDLDENSLTAYGYNTFVRKCDKKGKQVAFTPLDPQAECSKNIYFVPGAPAPAK